MQEKLIYDLSTLHENLHCTGSELFLLPWEKTKNKRGIWYFVTNIVLTYCAKKCSSDQEKLLKFEAEGQEFAKEI